MKPLAAFAALLFGAIVSTAQANPGMAQAGAAPAPASLSGEVLEVRSVESYTYLRLKTANGEIWAAVPTAMVSKGAQVTVARPMTMQNFESKALKKTFDKIVFGQLVDPKAMASAPHGGMPSPAAQPPVVAKVPKATGPDAKTVAEVVGGKAALKDKAVVVRGQVVKFSRDIMGKNWLHLRDGSGSAADGSNDILVTTKDLAAVGDIVNARGIVRTNVELGSGYSYAVLIEGAALAK